MKTGKTDLDPRTDGNSELVQPGQGNGTMQLRRRQIIAAVLSVAAGRVLAQSERTPIDVWKDPNCGCCKDWVKHLQDNGFTVRVFDTGNASARQQFGMPEAYGACHTGKVGRYVVEGHVPAREIRRLLRERPDAVGLAVPGMPIGAPGMDGPGMGKKDPYDVLLVKSDGSATSYQSYR